MTCDGLVTLLQKWKHSLRGTYAKSVCNYFVHAAYAMICNPMGSSDFSLLSTDSKKADISISHLHFWDIYR